MTERNRNIVLAHGFNVKDGGKATLLCLTPYLDYDSKQIAAYGYFNLAKVRLCNDNVAGLIKGMTLNRSIGIGHSNGCAILVRAAEMGATFDQLVLINPALDNDTEFPAQVRKIFVYHNPTDSVVTISKLLLWHPWGDMGRVGYTGKDKRVTNIDLHERFGFTGHSGHMTYPEVLAADINNQINN